MDRRQFIQLLGTASLVLAGGMVRMPVLNPRGINRDRFIQNSISANTNFIDKDLAPEGVNIDVWNSKLIYDIAGQFYDKLHLDGKTYTVMSGPMEIIRHPDTNEEILLTVKTRTTRQYITSEGIHVLTRGIKPELSKEIIKAWVEDATTGLASEFNSTTKDNSILGLYSIVLFQALDPNLYEPIIGFKIRYASF